MDMDMERSETSTETEKQVYIPGVSRELKNGEQLDFDPEAYKIFYSFETRWPCLSFDILKEDNPKLDFPLDCYVVAGSQADKAKNNELVVIGLKNLNPLEKLQGSREDHCESYLGHIINTAWVAFRPLRELPTG
ncbi:hypothetical protein DICVIV_11347 [Dictyocaulus viviparus]|uniref:Histone-binding protein RBBP4-like N-terminal domain-containing protein n=1 Tax=Dictyocaulus viviparus TaxID=29172 RepID=A0A0D8XG23_DICVI|nr:hypothetical protein DICVIV_11347 [Dictyocaulus viviparus]